MLIPWIILLFRNKIGFVRNYLKTIAVFQQAHVVIIIIIIFVLCPVSSMGLDWRCSFALRLCSPLCPPLFSGFPYPPRCISSLVFPPVFWLGPPSSSLSLWRYPPPFSSHGQTISISSSSTKSLN